MLESNIETKRLTQKMINELMDCHERELLKLEPCDASMVSSAGGLIRRGMVTTNSYILKSGKQIVALFTTVKGRSYLSKL